jgi:hypothetical protein
MVRFVERIKSQAIDRVNFELKCQMDLQEVAFFLEHNRPL